MRRRKWAIGLFVTDGKAGDVLSCWTGLGAPFDPHKLIFDDSSDDGHATEVVDMLLGNKEDENERKVELPAKVVNGRESVIDLSSLGTINPSTHAITIRVRFLRDAQFWQAMLIGDLTMADLVA